MITHRLAVIFWGKSCVGIFAIHSSTIVGKVNVVQKLVPFKLKRSAIMTWIAKVPLSKIKEQLGRLHHHDRLAGGGPEAVGVEDDR